MAKTIWPLAVLGAGKTGLSGSMGFRILDINEAVQVVFTTGGVVETNVPGDYVSLNGVSIPDTFQGRIEWGVQASGALAEETLNPEYVGKAGPRDFLAVLGSSKGNLSGSIGYRLLSASGTVVQTFTTTNVIATAVSGNYTATGGISLVGGFQGRTEWGTAGSGLAEEFTPLSRFDIAADGGIGLLFLVGTDTATGVTYFDIQGADSGTIVKLYGIQVQLPQTYFWGSSKTWTSLGQRTGPGQLALNLSAGQWYIAAFGTAGGIPALSLPIYILVQVPPAHPVSSGCFVNEPHGFTYQPQNDCVQVQV